MGGGDLEKLHSEPAGSPQPLTPAPRAAQACDHAEIRSIEGEVYSGQGGGTIGSQTSADPDYMEESE